MTLESHNHGQDAHIEQLTKQLQHSERMAAIGNLAAGVAHEINNPVGYVASNMRMLAEYSSSLIKLVYALAEHLPVAATQPLLDKYEFDYLQTDVPQLVRESEEGLNRVIAIIRDLKDFSYQDDNEYAATDLCQCIQSTLNIVNHEIKYKASVELMLTELPLIRCIPTQINQVIMNLLINAAQAITQHGTISIKTGVSPGHVWFSVADNGKGICATDLSAIYKPFFTTKPKGEGTGLGLALSKRIIDKHHGQINVVSTVGQGSCFTVSLPVDK